MWYRIFSSLSENSAYLKRNEGIALLLGAIVLACVLYLVGTKRRRRLPPGPTGLPIFGYYFSLGRRSYKTARDLGKKYGNVIGFHVGPQYIVILNDWEAMKDAISQTVHRPSSVFCEVPNQLGIIAANGVEWLQTRRLTSKAMKDVGLHDTRWEELIEEEALETVDCLFQQGGRPVNVQRLLAECFANNVLTLVLGKRLPAGHPLTKVVAESVDALVEASPVLGIVNFAPTLTKILRMIGVEENFQLKEKLQAIDKFVSDTVDERIRKCNLETDDSFITRFYEEVENHRKSKEKTYITENTLKGSVMALLAGGSETSRTTIIWTLIAMADNPDKQRKVHEELDRVIGKEGSIRWSDRFKIPYTLATLMESMRWRTVVPLSTMRMANEDIHAQGYYIPKGTCLTANIWAMHNDSRYWDNPDQFIPERFLLDGGKKVNTAAESYNPFSYGKRNCPGKLMAMMENLQYFGILMQNSK